MVEGVQLDARLQLQRNSEAEAVTNLPCYRVCVCVRVCCEMFSFFFACFSPIFQLLSRADGFKSVVWKQPVRWGALDMPGSFSTSPKQSELLWPEKTLSSDEMLRLAEGWQGSDIVKDVIDRCKNRPTM